MFGIEFPILAFSHCRDVVAAVSKAGGLGVLGVVAHSPAQLEIDLTWIEEEIGEGLHLDMTKMDADFYNMLWISGSISSVHKVSPMDVCDLYVKRG